MRVYPLNRWVSGTYKRECDRCGFDYLRNELIKDRRGLIVCPKCYDAELSYEERDRPDLTERPFIKD